MEGNSVQCIDNEINMTINRSFLLNGRVERSDYEYGNINKARGTKSIVFYRKNESSD